MATFRIAEGVISRIEHNFNIRPPLGAVVGVNFEIAKATGVQLAKTLAFRSQQVETEVPDMTSYLGTPIFDPFRFLGGRFFRLEDVNKEEDPINYPDDEGPEGFGLIIPAAIIEVTQSKNIITTAIQGRAGTVKQFISDGDFLITVTGVLAGQNINGEVVDIGNNYPFEDVQKLVRICKVPDPISVTSNFLGQIFGINEVVITNYNIPQKEGSRDTQPFQISMLSDVPIDLNELEPTRVISVTISVPSEPVIIVT